MCLPFAPTDPSHTVMTCLKQLLYFTDTTGELCVCTSSLTDALYEEGGREGGKEGGGREGEREEGGMEGERC